MHSWITIWTVGGSADDRVSIKWTSKYMYSDLSIIMFFYEKGPEIKGLRAVCLKARSVEGSNFVDCVRQEAATFHVGAF